ncbi:hypothetical protein BDK51DRAFT_34825, partial [Blyttiomyces helicus]
ANQENVAGASYYALRCGSHEQLLQPVLLRLLDGTTVVEVVFNVYGRLARSSKPPDMDVAVVFLNPADARLPKSRYDKIQLGSSNINIRVLKMAHPSRPHGGPPPCPTRKPAKGAIGGHGFKCFMRISPPGVGVTPLSLGSRSGISGMFGIVDGKLDVASPPWGGKFRGAPLDGGTNPKHALDAHQGTLNACTLNVNLRALYADPGLLSSNPQYLDVNLHALTT